MVQEPLPQAYEQAVVAAIREHFPTQYVGGGVDGTGCFYGTLASDPRLSGPDFVIVPPVQFWRGVVDMVAFQPKGGVYRLIVAGHDRGEAPDIPTLANCLLAPSRPSED